MIARKTLLVVAAVGLVTLSAPTRAEEIFYYVDQDRVVFTNVPSRPDAKVVPWVDRVVTLSHSVLPKTPYDAFITRVSREHGLDPALVKAVAMVESSMDPTAVSPKGAIGLMQLMPATARQYGVTDPTDPHQNLRAGVQHLRGLIDEFDGDLNLALAAYNAGSGAVRRHGGIPAYRETQEYVKKVRGTLGYVPKTKKKVLPTEATAGDIMMKRTKDGGILLEN